MCETITVPLYQVALRRISDPFNILSKIHNKQSYSSGEPIPEHIIRSSDGCYPAYALLDKLSFSTPISFSDKEAISRGLRWKCIEDNKKKIWVYVYDYKYTYKGLPYSTRITINQDRPFKQDPLVTVNPSHFPNIQYLMDSLFSLYEPEQILEGRIVRLDCSVDILRPFQQELIGVTFHKKKIKEKHTEGGKITGLYIGKSRRGRWQNLLLVYDKQKESNLDFFVTRYEVSDATKLLLKDLSKICKHTPFSFIRRNELKIIEPVNKTKKFYDFKIRCEDKGFYLTKSTLNKD